MNRHVWKERLMMWLADVAWWAFALNVVYPMWIRAYITRGGGAIDREYERGQRGKAWPRSWLRG